MQSATAKLSIPSLSIATGGEVPEPLEQALRLLEQFCRESRRMEVTRVASPEGVVSGLLLVCGRELIRRHLRDVHDAVDWEGLGQDGYVLRVLEGDGKRLAAVGGLTGSGTRFGVYHLLRLLDITTEPISLPAELNIRSVPAFEMRGMYAHQHWAYEHPYALRTWSVDEWKRYVDILVMLGFNLLQIWSMAAMLPLPLSEGDETFLRRYPPVMDYARSTHGMEVWIGECANNVCDRRDVPPIEERRYFDVETLKDPSDPAQLADLRAARAEFYGTCSNADGYWVIDSDPGKWEGSPASEFVDILKLNRELIDEHAELSSAAKLVYWMHFGWGNGSREENWRETIAGLSERVHPPWWLEGGKAHLGVVSQFDAWQRFIYYQYGAIEPEPSNPFTRVVPPELLDALEISDRARRFKGILGNAQTPVVQLPNIYYFARCAWDLEARHASIGDLMQELAVLIYPDIAGLLTDCWMSLRGEDGERSESLAVELEGRLKTDSLGRPGPVAMKLFPDYGQIAKDLVWELRLHAGSVAFTEGGVGEEEVMRRLIDYCLLSLAWRRHTGFRLFAFNGYTFDRLKAAIPGGWKQDDGRLRSDVYSGIQRALSERYEDWEVKLAMVALDHP